MRPNATHVKLLSFTEFSKEAKLVLICPKAFEGTVGSCQRHRFYAGQQSRMEESKGQASDKFWAQKDKLAEEGFDFV